MLQQGLDKEFDEGHVAISASSLKSFESQIDWVFLAHFLGNF